METRRLDDERLGRQAQRKEFPGISRSSERKVAPNFGDNWLPPLRGKSCAEQDGRDCKDDQSNGIPFWSELGAFIPRCHCPGNRREHTDDRQDPRVCHRPVRREARGEVATADRVGSPINRCQHDDMGWPSGGKTPVACIARSVAMERIAVARKPASTAPMPRVRAGRVVTLRRDGFVSVMTSIYQLVLRLKC